MEEVKSKLEEIKLPYRIPTGLNGTVWWVCFVVVLALSLLASISILIEGVGDPMNWVYALFCLLAFPFMLLKLGPTLWVTQEGLSYREFFKTQKLAWSSIQEIKTTASFTPKYRLKGGMIEMDIYHHAVKTPNPVAINLKVFKRKGLVTLAGMLGENAPQARMDEMTENIRKGSMPSAVMELLKELSK